MILISSAFYSYTSSGVMVSAAVQAVHSVQSFSTVRSVAHSAQPLRSSVSQSIHRCLHSIQSWDQTNQFIYSVQFFSTSPLLIQSVSNWIVSIHSVSSVNLFVRQSAHSVQSFNTISRVSRSVSQSVSQSVSSQNPVAQSRHSIQSYQFNHSRRSVCYSWETCGHRAAVGNLTHTRHTRLAAVWVSNSLLLERAPPLSSIEGVRIIWLLISYFLLWVQVVWGWGGSGNSFVSFQQSYPRSDRSRLRLRKTWTLDS
jgi:hypothetical protein